MSGAFPQRSPTSYIVRVYRYQRSSQQIAGVVENPELQECAAFATFDELKAILLRPGGRVTAGRRGKKPRVRASKA